MKRAGRGLRKTVQVLVALALVFLSFAHHPVLARQITPEMAASYMLPDGSIGDICFGLDGVDDGGHGSPHRGLVPVCDYCRLTGAVLLPSPPDDNYLVLQVASSSSARQDFKAVLIGHINTLPQSRAPPVLT